MRNSFEERVVQKQAARISAQQQQISELNEANQRLALLVDEYQKPAKYWMQLQKLLLQHPMLYEEWERFMMFVHLHCDRKDAPGFTCED